jgi:hypothetical protein
VLDIDARLAQALHLDAPALVVPDGANVLGAQTQPRARHQRAGHLPARADHLFLEQHLPGVCRKVRHN